MGLNTPHPCLDHLKSTRNLLCVFPNHNLNKKFWPELWLHEWVDQPGPRYRTHIPYQNGRNRTGTQAGLRTPVHSEYSLYRTHIPYQNGRTVHALRLVSEHLYIACFYHPHIPYQYGRQRSGTQAGFRHLYIAYYCLNHTQIPYKYDRNRRGNQAGLRTPVHTVL